MLKLQQACRTQAFTAGVCDILNARNLHSNALVALSRVQFNAGASHPTVDSSSEKVAAGLRATVEVVQGNASMALLAARRAALVAAAQAPQYQLTQLALQVRPKPRVLGTLRYWGTLVINEWLLCCESQLFTLQ